MTTPKNDHAGIWQVIRVLKKAGWNPKEITDPETVNVQGLSPKAIADQITKNYDEAVVIFEKEFPAENYIDSQWVYFVLGNDPEEVVCDYTISNEEFDNIVTTLVGSW